MSRKRWHTILDRLPPNRVCKVAEVGVFKGELSRAVLSSHPKVKMMLVDPWVTSGMVSFKEKSKLAQEQLDEMYFDVLTLSREYQKRCIVMRNDSVSVAKSLKGRTLDMVFIDADHGYEAVKKDIEAWSKRVKKGGWIGGHDYGEKFPGVKQAVDEAFGDAVEIDTNSTWWVKV